MITLNQLAGAIRQVATTEPDFIYRTIEDDRVCTYTENALNGCGCIVGEALSLLGVPRERLRALDLMALGNVDTAWRSSATVLELADLVEQDALHSSWVRLVQEEQDLGRRWAAAVARADERVGAPA